MNSRFAADTTMDASPVKGLISLPRPNKGELPLVCRRVCGCDFWRCEGVAKVVLVPKAHHLIIATPGALAVDGADPDIAWLARSAWKSSSLVVS